MHIREVKTAKKYGDFVLRDQGPNLIDIVYCGNITKDQLRDKTPRVYLITSDGVIKKIGGSADKNGIRGTISFYVGAMTGSPGIARFIGHHLIYQELQAMRSVELFVITAAGVNARVPGLFDYTQMQVHAFKEMESSCLSDYFDYANKFPDWNFQESNQSYPNELATLHNDFQKRRIASKTN